MKGYLFLLLSLINEMNGLVVLVVTVVVIGRSIKRKNMTRVKITNLTCTIKMLG